MSEINRSKIPNLNCVFCHDINHSSEECPTVKRASGEDAAGVVEIEDFGKVELTEEDIEELKELGLDMGADIRSKED